MTEEAKTVEVVANTTEETKTEEVVTTPLSEDDLKAVEDVKGRLKFFFSDANVRQDFFIRKLLMKDHGDNPRMVPVESLLKFNTVKQHTTKPAVVIHAAKALPELLTVDEKETAIGRAVPFTGGMMNDNIPKSLYVKNLPLKEDPKQYAVTMNEIREVFDKYGQVVLVKLKWSSTADGKGDEDLIGQKRRQKRQKFPVGCAMVEFETAEGLEKAAEATLTTKKGEKVEPKDKIVMSESELEVLMLEEYIEARKKEKAAEEKENGGSKKREREEDKEEGKESATFTVDWKPGCVITMKGLPETCDREAILDTIATALDISVDEAKTRKIYADYSRGQSNGAIRFPEVADHIAETATRLKNGELQVRGVKIEDARVLEGDEEKKYWNDFIEFKNKQILHKDEEKRSRKKFFKRGRK
jgi:hypothetical protein